MPEPIVKINVRGLEQVQTFLQNLPRGALRVVLKAVGDFFVSSEVLQKYPGYKYVSRRKAYGQTFSSDKQRAYVMAKIKSGEITPGRANRSGATAGGWKAVTTREGYSMRIENREPGAYYTMGDPGQARQPKLAGWKTITEVIQANMSKAMQVARQALRDWINRHGR